MDRWCAAAVGPQTQIIEPCVGHVGNGAPHQQLNLAIGLEVRRWVGFQVDCDSEEANVFARAVVDDPLGGNVRRAVHRALGPATQSFGSEADLVQPVESNGPMLLFAAVGCRRQRPCHKRKQPPPNPVSAAIRSLLVPRLSAGVLSPSEELQE